MNFDDNNVAGQGQEDGRLARTIAAAAPADPAATSFDLIWARAERVQLRSRRRYRQFAGAAVLVATLVVVLNIGNQAADDARYIHVADLLDSTSWAAPSDALLPNHQFDIYQEFPAFIASTRPVEGALL